MSTYFQKLYIRISFTLMLITIALTGFLYYNFKAYSLELLNAADERQLQAVFENALQFHEYAKAFTTSLYQHPDATQLMMGDPRAAIETVNSLRNLDSSVNAAPFLHSVYLYNGQADIVYMVGPNAISRASADFFDEEAVRIWRAHPSGPVPREIASVSRKTNAPAEVFSYLLTDFSAGTEKPNSAIAVNVRIDWLFNPIVPFREQPGLRDHSFLVLNAEGIAVAHSSRDRFLTNLSEEPYIRQLLRSGESSGSFQTDIDGVSSVVTYSTDSSSGWRMVNITPYAVVAGTVNKVRTLTLIIGTSMAVICLLSAFLLSRNLYSPVRTLRATVDKLTDPPADDANRDEFAYIANTLARTQDRLRSLSSFKQTHTEALKQTLLRNVLSRSMPGDYEALFHEYNVALDPRGSLAIVLFKIDRYSDFERNYNDGDRVLLKYAMMNIAEEVVQADYRGACADMGTDHIALLINVEETPNDHLRRLCGNIQDSFRQYCSIGASVFISNFATSFREAGLLYEETLALSRYRLRFGHGCILQATEFAEERVKDLIINPSAFAKLTESLRKGNLEETEKHYAEMESELENASYDSIVYNLSAMTALVFQTITTLEKNSTVSFELDYATFDQSVKSKETLRDIHEEFRSLFRAMLAKMHQNKAERSTLLVEHAQKFIRQHYKDKSLSTHMVADRLELTTAYLGKLFREHLSKSIADFITEVRLEEAANLLRETSHTVDEIVDQVGWENKKYFFTIFKKRFGATPTEFRLKSKLDTI